MISTYLIAGFLTALALYILLLKIGIERFVKHHVITDLAVSCLFTALMSGTVLGLMTSIIAGLSFSGMLFVTKKYYDIKNNVSIKFKR